MKLNRCRQKLAVGLLALMTGVADHSLSNAQAPTTNREVTEAFSSLKSLSIQRMQELGPRGGAEVLRLRGVFLRHGDDAGRFLVTQLRQLNADEAKHVSGPMMLRVGRITSFRSCWTVRIPSSECRLPTSWPTCIRN